MASGKIPFNPCFELWLILHERDYDRPDHRDAVQRELKKLLPEYDNRRGSALRDLTPWPCLFLLNNSP